ncbi:MAG: succinate dehydrogenase/fumarate reductase iron-sulfur subunit [Deltaproteobacteria bacterium]|nr:succinate dehydrogenase/fumarate reductase iron-sulfur subunit [Deltaproteobacteria bacterium]
MRLTLRIWRQKDRNDPGGLQTYQLDDANEHMSFLEMLDVLNQHLIEKGDEPVAFEHDCREGICGACSLVINGVAHGPLSKTTVCQLHMRFFHEGQTITIEPWRAKGFPVLRDLIVDRSSFDRIMQAGGFIDVRTGAAPDANAIPIAKPTSDLAMDAAECIGCGACVAACPNGSAMLFVAAKASHLNLLPQGLPEKARRARAMVKQMEAEGFGSCTNFAECEAQCPKGISINFIAKLNRDFMKASLFPQGGGGKREA